MRLHEFVLNEDTAEYRDLTTISKYIADYMIKYKPMRFVTASDMAKQMQFPQITAGTMINLLFDVQLAFSLIPPKQAEGALGWYEPKDYSITVDKRLTRHRPELITTLAHEMQHALDDFKSAGHALRKPENYAGHNQDFVAYLKLHPEINARFTQALLDIVDAEAKSKYSIGRVGTTKETMTQIVPLAFQKNKLNKTLLDQKQLNRLLSRAYKFYDEVKDTIEAAPEQPKSTLIGSLKQLIGRYVS
jgi:hypothetical protein